MTHTLAHSIRLYPTGAQETFFRKACGCARVAYNYGLQEYKKILDQKGKPNVLEIKKQFNRDKKKLFPWMSETNKDANQQPFKNLQSAFTKFFKRQAKFPRFKKKGIKDSFYISNDKFDIDSKKFWVPKLGWVLGAEELRFKGKINSATVKRVSSYWFVVVSVATDQNFTACENQEAVGVDLGSHHLATLSNGEQIEAKHPLRRRLDHLKFLQRQLSRKVKGSQNRRKAGERVAKLHYRIACVRKDALDQLTTSLCRDFKIICIEDLNVAGMLKNHKLALTIADLGFGEFRRQLEYKKLLYGNTVVVIPRFFPSSKTCSCCGWKNENLKLSDRVFVCQQCGLVIDRDLNAAINIRDQGLKQLKQLGAVSSEVTPVEMEALAVGNDSETTVYEAGISECTHSYT